MHSNHNEFKGHTSSYWLDSVKETEYPSLQEDIKTDVVIVGGGMAGITTAFLLKEKGLKAAVLEADRILYGTTGHTTAKVTSQHSLIYARIKNQMGEELTHQYADANESAIDLVASLVQEHKIDCDFSWQPAYMYTNDPKYIKDLEDEYQAASGFGIKASLNDRIDTPFTIKRALKFDRQAQFHPVKYLQVLAEKISGDGSAIYENTPAVNIDKEKGQVITRHGHTVTADKIVIASHYPFFDGGGLYFSRVYADKSYIIGIKAEEKFPEGMYINAETPTRSLRSQRYKDGEMILIGGEHHKTGDGTNLNQHYQNLIDFAHQNYEVQEVLYRWSTQDCMTADGLPYTGVLTGNCPNIYVATGFGKWGMTNSTASAMIISDLITTGDSPWAPVYNPSRFNLSAFKKVFIEGVDFTKEYISGKFTKDPEDIELAKGEAKEVLIDGQRVGAYRDDQGELHMVDITCTHLGCELKWNDAEISWDCPCHGSRFSPDGDIIEGPAFNHLQEPGAGENHVELRIFK
ncbi:MAG TPA: FAD-dependent oxidoreductase [Syntrophomonadaceae bacterium]|jgi:glycine/D-amino acid oxidase-like deaminating enzyme/nitrite reductase/ring-hydroxylating ferredoxin subunit|nr:FAD-dependent oxidoreductase [Syntrophomonadaceae bacterium]HRX21042.1 FAD-dependent oxidoreductase [Syntrophomonadaceae bacterium]